MIKKSLKYAYITLLLLLCFSFIKANNGYNLWLNYEEVQNSEHKKSVEQLLQNIRLNDNSPTSEVIREEINRAAKGMLGIVSSYSNSFNKKTGIYIATGADDIPLNAKGLALELKELGEEGYIISYLSSGKKKQVIIAANSPVGALYGTFHLLRLLSSGTLPGIAPILESPSISHRLLNHWDNLDRTVERGYAGFSIWDWHKLPGYIDQRYIDYARANASIGINGTVLSNVNANALVLSPEYIKKVAALADVFRPYGIKVYLTARFSAPIEIGNLETADPLNPMVKEWWNDKAGEIYQTIPDFGGFLVKANSEGQPGPQNYNRSHAEGANMLADALAPHGGIVMWRAFVYSQESPEDRAKQANNEFVPLDGKFRNNVVIQVKNGAIDFQPREPFHPLFGAMPETNLALELQITQEYLGQGTSLAYLSPMFKECLESRTYRPNKATKVSDIIDGSAYDNELTVMAGVSNIGNDINWTGHPFGQANWYAYGRLAWAPSLSSEKIAEEWIKATFGNDEKILNPIIEMMMSSREAVLNYMTPLGLHHIMGRNHHYGPGPWVSGGRADWTSIYYHRADSLGIGFNRTASGSNALSQYAKEIVEIYSDPSECPEQFLLWFHHLPWSYEMQSGRSLWDEMCYSYDKGVREIENIISKWETLESRLDSIRYNQVLQLLYIQLEEAEWWKNSCLLYFQQFSGMPFPDEIETPKGKLKDYIDLEFPYAPGIKPTW
jgi:alpha-glucuronidase